MTEEEKKAKLLELRQKLAEKRAAQSQEDVKAAKANEALRRKAGQDSGKIKEDMTMKEVQKETERKRQEKIADQKARADIKAQIEADKRERAAKAAQGKAARQGQAMVPEASTSTPSKPAAAVKSSENPETRLQIRLSAGGQPLTKTFPSDNSELNCMWQELTRVALIDVAEFVASESLAYTVDTVTFASTFPR